MASLQYPLSDIPSEGLVIDETVAEIDLRPADAKEVPMEPVRIAGRLSELGGVYQFRGTLSGAHQGISDWTGEMASDPFTVQVEWYFVEGDPDEDDDDLSGTETIREDGTLSTTHVYHGECLDLARAAWEDIVLARPIIMPWQTSAASGLGMDLAKEPYVSGKLGAEDAPAQGRAFGRLADLFPKTTPQKE